MTKPTDQIPVECFNLQIQINDGCRETVLRKLKRTNASGSNHRSQPSIAMLHVEKKALAAGGVHEYTIQQLHSAWTKTIGEIFIEGPKYFGVLYAE